MPHESTAALWKAGDEQHFQYRDNLDSTLKALHFNKKNALLH